MRLFLLRSLNSCSDLLNSPPFKALPLFEKPHVRAAPSRFAHSAPKQGHRASRAFANPTIGFALGNYSRAIPLAARTSSAGGMPTTQNAHLLWWFARYFCSPAPLGGGDYPGREANRDATRYAQRPPPHIRQRRSRWGLSPKCEPWPTPGRPSPMSPAEGGDPQARHHGCDRCLRFRKSSLVLDTIAAQSRRELNGIFPSFTQRYLPKYGRPHVGLIHSLPPAIAIDQSKPSGRVRSTVDTQTDTYSLLRKIIDGTLAFVMHGISESKKTC